MMKAVRRGSTVEEQRPRANLLERGFPMGKKVDEALDIAYEDVPTYLHTLITPCGGKPYGAVLP